MKKILSLILALIFALGILSSCTNEPELPTEVVPPVTEEFADPLKYPKILDNSVEISAGQIYFASTEEQGYTANEAFAYANGGRWSSAQNDVNAWIEVEFETEATVKGITLAEYRVNKWSNVQRFNVLAFNSATQEYEVIYSGGEIKDNEIIRFNSAVKTDKIRIHVTQNGVGAVVVSLTKIAVFGERQNANDVIELNQWFDLPFVSKGKAGKFLFLAGGYNSVDRGAPEWGTLDYEQSLILGDNVGEIVIYYTDGKIQAIPLIFGYTMWFSKNWGTAKMPFQGLNATSENKTLLNDTLHCYNADIGDSVPFIKIKVRDTAIANVEVQDNPEKIGNPIYIGGYLSSAEELLLSGKHSVNTKNKFFRSHTISSGNSLPQKMNENILNLTKATVTVPEDFLQAPDFVYPSEYSGAKIQFGGDKIAEIMSGVYYYNTLDMKKKVRSSGYVDESTEKSPNYEYDGIGTYAENRGQYYGSMFSRNGKAITNLSYTGYLSDVNNVVNYSNKQLMYHRENNLKLLNKQIPGHWGVMIDKPLVYSQQLAPSGWPTRYTKAKFGNDYQNMGNIEPDGHGLTMMAIYNIWRTNGSSAQWVNDNWKYINEAVEFLDWCTKNPDVSFSENNLIYGESEGGMMTFTMYNNIPCYIGVKMYTEMAQAANKTESVAAWTDLSSRMKDGINRVFKSGDRWQSEKFGFFHDPFISQYADYTGYDLKDMPSDWVNASKGTYANDLNAYIKDSFVGPRGIGYDHNIISQNALLLDKVEDYDKFVRNLAKLSYAPRQPQPYIVPEGTTYDVKKGYFRRQGDLGNLAQQAESVKTILMSMGLSQYHDGAVKLMPRLPIGWTVDVKDILIPGDGGALEFNTGYPTDGSQNLNFKMNSKNASALKFRAGPFAKGISSASVTINGANASFAVEESGSAAWVWITVSDISANTLYNINVRAK